MQKHRGLRLGSRKPANHPGAVVAIAGIDETRPGIFLSSRSLHMPETGHVTALAAAAVMCSCMRRRQMGQQHQVASRLPLCSRSTTGKRDLVFGDPWSIPDFACTPHDAHVFLICGRVDTWPASWTALGSTASALKQAAAAVGTHGTNHSRVRSLLSLAEADAAVGDFEGDVLLFPAGIRLRGVTAANAGAVMRCVSNEFAMKERVDGVKCEGEPKPVEQVRDNNGSAAMEGMSLQQRRRHSINRKRSVHNVTQKRLLCKLQEAVPGVHASALPHASLTISSKAGDVGGVFAHIFVCVDHLPGPCHKMHGLTLVNRFRDLACSEGLRRPPGCSTRGRCSEGGSSNDRNGSGGVETDDACDFRSGLVSVRPCAYIDSAYQFDGRAVIFTTVAATPGLLQLPGHTEDKSFPFVGDWYGFLRSAVVDEIFAKHIVGGLTLGVVWRGRCGLDSQMMKHAASELLSLNPCTTSLRRLDS